MQGLWTPSHTVADEPCSSWHYSAYLSGVELGAELAELFVGQSVVSVEGRLIRGILLGELLQEWEQQGWQGLSGWYRVDVKNQ